MIQLDHIAHLRGDETGAELGEEMRRLARAAEIYFNLPVAWDNFDLSLRNRTETNNGVVDESAERVRRIGHGIKDATISLEPDDPRPGIRGSPNARLRKGIQTRDSLGTVIVRHAGPLPYLPPRVPGLGYDRWNTTVVRQGAGGFYNADISYSGPGNRPNRRDLNQTVFTKEPVTRAQHRTGAMFAFITALRNGSTVVGGPKYTINDGDGAFSRELRRARDVFSGKPVMALTGGGILYSNDPEDTLATYQLEITEERRKLGLPNEGLSEEALVTYNEWLIDALYAFLLEKGPASLKGGQGSNMVVPTNNRDGDCLSDLIGPLYSSVAGMTSEITAVNDLYKPTSVIAEAAHGTAPRSFQKNRANPLAMFLALAMIYQHLSESHDRSDNPVEQNYRRAARAIRKSCMGVLENGLMTADFARRVESVGGQVKRVLSMTEFTSETMQGLSSI
jgi:isocitrate dehydrogenase